MTSGLVNWAAPRCQEGPRFFPCFLCAVQLLTFIYPQTDSLYGAKKAACSSSVTNHYTALLSAFFLHFKNEETFPRSPQQISPSHPLVLTVSHVRLNQSLAKGLSTCDLTTLLRAYPWSWK